MADLLFIGMMFAFFGLAVVLVRLCDHIIGPEDDIVVGAADYSDEGEEIAGMSYDNAVALILSILVTAYLVYALIAPEKL